MKELRKRVDRMGRDISTLKQTRNMVDADKDALEELKVSLILVKGKVIESR